MEVTQAYTFNVINVVSMFDSTFFDKPYLSLITTRKRALKTCEPISQLINQRKTSTLAQQSYAHRRGEGVSWKIIRIANSNSLYLWTYKKLSLRTKFIATVTDYVHFDLSAMLLRWSIPSTLNTSFVVCSSALGSFFCLCVLGYQERTASTTNIISRYGWMRDTFCFRIAWHRYVVCLLFVLVFLHCCRPF